jgi:hypothetical protein
MTKHSGYIYCPYIPLITMEINAVQINWDGPMFGEFIRVYMQENTDWHETTILSAIEDYRIEDKRGRDDLLDMIWNFVLSKYDKTPSYLTWLREVCEQYREYQRSIIVGDRELKEVMSI